MGYGFSNLNVREQGEKPSPRLRQSAKAAPQNLESSSSAAWNPNWEGRAETESWGTPYHHTPEHRAQAKAIDGSWGGARMRSQRAERDAIMEGGSSPPSKKRTASKTFMDDVDDPHGEVRLAMTAQERREQDRFSLDVKSPKGYKTREVQLTRTYLWGDEQSSSGGESVGVKVTWEPESGSKASPIVKEIRLNPDKIDEEGMTWDSDAMNPKGEAGPKMESSSSMMTRSSAKKGKVSMKRKPRLAASMTARSASREADTGAPQEKARKLKPKFRVGEVVRFRANQVPGEDHKWKRGVVTDLIHPGDPENLWEIQSFNYMVLSDQLDEKNRMEETVTSEGNMEALADYPFVESKQRSVLVISLLNTLHDLSYVGIDTCSAVSFGVHRKE
jgi:hypothetical protein